MERKYSNTLLKWWLGRQYVDGRLEKVECLSWNEYQHLLKTLKAYKNDKWRNEQNGNDKRN